MEEFKILLPYNGEEEQGEIIKLADGMNGVAINLKNIRNIDGTFMCEIIGQLQDLIALIGAMASIACLREKKASIFDNANKSTKQNVKIKDIELRIKKGDFSFFYKKKTKQ